MFFIVSKLVSWLIDPMTWVVGGLIMAAIGVLSSRSVLIQSGIIVALWLVFLIGWTPISQYCLRQLEISVPNPSIDYASVAGIIVLGGAIDAPSSPMISRDIPLNSNAERMTRTVELAKHYPHLPIIFTGDSSALRGSYQSEAQLAAQFFQDQGIKNERIIVEARSRNTLENARYCSYLISSRRPWVIVTSAYHMHRSLQVFRRYHLNVVPLSVDFRSPADLEWLDFSFEQGYSRWKLVLHERVGEFVYRYVK